MATLYTQNCSPDLPPLPTLKPYFLMAPPKSQQPPYLVKNEHLLGNQQNLA